MLRKDKLKSIGFCKLPGRTTEGEDGILYSGPCYIITNTQLEIPKDKFVKENVVNICIRVITDTAYIVIKDGGLVLPNSDIVIREEDYTFFKECYEESQTNYERL